jgi:hypothetical protein
MRTFAPIAVAVAVATFAFAPAATAEIECDGMQRSFTGELQKANDKMIVVDNKKGDKIKFEKHESTTVSGVKAEWDDLKKGDYVSVCSKMLEKPRYAYKVESMEPPEDD